MKQQRISVRGIPFLAASILLASTAFAQSCPYDLDGDEQVNTSDLVLLLSEETFSGADLGNLLAAWGPCPQCPGDLDGSGVVDGADLSVALMNYTDESKLENLISVLANWGVVCGASVGPVPGPVPTTATATATPTPGRLQTAIATKKGKK